MNPIDVLRPNYLGDTHRNQGVTDVEQNYGIGVSEAMGGNKQGWEQLGLFPSAPEVAKDNLRTQKAREFGLTKKTVGF